MNAPVTTFSGFYKKRYGRSVGKIALSTSVVCPNREHGGCHFCRPASFTPYYLAPRSSLAVQLARGRDFLKRRGIQSFLGYFQQESSTAGTLSQVLEQVRAVLAEPDCLGVICSTRPDCLEDQLLAGLAGLVRQSGGKELLLELGLQSAHDRTLQAMNRNHTLADFTGAVARIRHHAGLQVGAHLILGLPGEDYFDMLHTVRLVAAVGIDAVKFHNLQIIEGTELALRHRRKPIATFDAEPYLDLLGRLLCYLPQKVVVHRLWSWAAPDLLLAPRWNIPAPQLNPLLARRMALAGYFQGKFVAEQGGAAPAAARCFPKKP